jgi:hypothetical protein
MAWKKGPLPPNTWNWGGVVPAGDDPFDGFSFADFCGDHVDMAGGGTLKANEVGWYDNSIELPPKRLSGEK